MITFLTIGLAMFVSVLLGFVWYGPLFGKTWMKLSGIPMPDTKPSFKTMLKPIGLSFIGAGLLTFVLSSIIEFHNQYYHVGDFVPSLSMTFLVWLGLIVPTYLNLSGWEGKPWKLFFINTGYWLVYLMIVASLIVAIG